MGIDLVFFPEGLGKILCTNDSAHCLALSILSIGPLQARRTFLMLLLVEGEEKECLPKFGVLIFILAHEIKQVYSLSWKHSI